MSAKEKNMSKTILTWVAGAVRPLSTTELRFILERTTMDEIDDIGTVISKYCHDLVYIDKNSVVKMRHESARGFLLRRDINSEFSTDLTIQEEAAHKVLAMACLEYLNGPEMKAKPKRRMVASSNQRSIFVNYACQAVHEHVNRSSALDSDILRELATFLKSNILSWLEHLATSRDLETVLQFAQVLKIFLRRKSRVDLLLGEEVVVIDLWATDLVKLVSKFGTQLLMHPESILQLIPPFCPSDSAPFSQFGRGPGTVISVTGLSKKTWDDCLCTLVLSEPQASSSKKIVRERLHSLGTSDLSFCIGTSIGRILVFNDKTCLEERALNHKAAVIHLQFANSGTLLASASKKMIRIWNTESWEQQWEIPLRYVSINLIDRSQTETRWTDSLDDPHRQYYHGTSAKFASFNPDLGLLAVGYAARSVLVYNYDMDTYQIFHHKDGLSEFIDENSNVNLTAMTFSKLPDSSLLAVSYSTSDLVLFDTEAGTIQATVPSAYFSRLVSSPDGRTLAAARMDGAIELYDFETLHKLYRIRPDEGAVAALAFTADNTRFLVIRAGGHHCRVWDPASLYRRDVGHHSVKSPSLGSGSQDGVLEEQDDDIALITSMACDAKGDCFFVGKDDGSVYAYDARTGLFDDILFSHAAPIKAVHFATTGPKQLLLSVDSAGSLSVNAIMRLKHEWSVEELFTHRAVTGVQQFLCNKSSTHVLICSNDEATLLSMMTGERVGIQVDCKNDKNEPYLWAQHPTDDALILYITTCSVHIYRWSAMECITKAPNGIQLAECLLTKLHVSTATTMFNGPSAVLITKHATPGQRGKLVTRCFAGNEFAVESTTVSPLVEFQGVCNIMDMIIGTYRDRVIFLHTDGWICSFKSNGLRDGEGILHHFAPPVDWLRTTRDLIIRVSRLGDVLFVVKGEVAIVKRGLGRAAQIRDI
ncbi:WD40-repeat-containing domain protein [Xylariaceae sp. FL0662B]|nr:WD40-repeat-containing domain protein [Xylariaceae sp. FL0662B]